MVKGQRNLLPPEDEEHLRQVAATGSDRIRQRVQLILGWQEGLTAVEIARQVQLSENQVRYLLRLFRQKGLDLFLIDDTPPVVEAVAEPVQPEPELEPPGVTLDALAAEYNVNVPHARHIAAHALTLFDATANIHRLPGTTRTLLEAAALVHNIAFAGGADKHDERGCDIIMSQQIRGFSDAERQILACIVAFHSKRVQTNREPLYTELPAEHQRDVLGLTAILRIADGLDSTQTQTTTIQDIQVQPEEITVVVEGIGAHDNSTRAQVKADLWNKIFAPRIRISAAAVPQPVEVVMPRLAPALNSSMSVTRAGRVFTEHTLDRIDSLLKAVQDGDMRLLPSLAREASRLTEAIVLADAKDFRKETRWFLDAVEEARLAAALAERAAILSEDPETPILPALVQKANAWQQEAQAASRALDVRRYKQLACDLRWALAEDVELNENALMVFHVGSILWDQLASLPDVMEYGTSVTDA